MNKAREIAERLNLTIRHINDNDMVFIPSEDGIGNRRFNPYESWNDCGMVLEALARSAHVVCIGSGKLIIITSPLTKQEIYPFTKDGICEAFLSMEGV